MVSRPPSERVFIGLGSNLGDRRVHLEAALSALSALAGTTVLRVSSFVPSAPWGETDQPEFLNAVAEIATSLPPQELLDELLRIERELGRRPTYRWGPRVIDLDLLLYGRRAIESDRLQVPHPRLRDRPFVLEPLMEIAPDALEGVFDAAVPLRSG